MIFIPALPPFSTPPGAESWADWADEEVDKGIWPRKLASSRVQQPTSEVWTLSLAGIQQIRRLRLREEFTGGS